MNERIIGIYDIGLGLTSGNIKPNWSKPMQIVEETKKAAKESRIKKHDLVRYPVENYFVIDILTSINLNTGEINMVGGMLANDKTPLQFARIEKLKT